MLKELHIWWLKNRAKRAYLNCRNVCDEYSCGTSLAMEISPRAASYALKFNATMDHLAKLDSNTPAARL